MANFDDIRAWTRKITAERDSEDMDLWLLAVITVVAREINILRALHGLAPRTRQQVADAIRTSREDLLVD